MTTLDLDDLKLLEFKYPSLRAYHERLLWERDEASADAKRAHQEVSDLVSLILKAHNDPEDAANILGQAISTREDAHGSWRVVDIDKLRGK